MIPPSRKTQYKLVNWTLQATLLLCLLVLSNEAFAQKADNENESETKVQKKFAYGSDSRVVVFALSGDIDLVNDCCKLGPGKKIGEEEPDFIYLDSVSVVNGELVINYRVNKNFANSGLYGPKVKNGLFRVLVNIELNSQPIPLTPNQIFGDAFEVRYQSDNKNKEIVIAGLMEKYSNFEGQLLVRLIVTYNPLDCYAKPKLNGMEWATAGVLFAGGVTLIGMSVRTNSNASDIYDEYLMITRPGGEAEKYKEYQDKIDQANLQLGIGIGLLAMDGLFVLWRVLELNNRKEQYRTRCASSSVMINHLELRPKYEFNNLIPEASNVGLAINYRF